MPGPLFDHHLTVLILTFISFILIAVTPVYGLSVPSCTDSRYNDTTNPVQRTADDPMVWNVDITGNRTFRSMVLQNQIATESPSFFRKLRFWNRTGYEFDEAEIRRDVVRLERFYLRRGFYHTDIIYQVEEGRRQWRKNITFEIQEGDPVIVNEVTYSYEEGATQGEKLLENRTFRRALERHELQPESRYQLLNHSDVEARLLDALNDIGYPFARVNIMADVDESDYSADIHIHIDPGPLATINEIYVEGNETLDEKLILRHSNLSTGSLYSQSTIQESQRHIFSHHLFRFATLGLPEQPRDSTVTVRIRVREYPLRSLQTQIGAGWEEIVRGAVRWEHRNPWGTGHRFQSRLRASYIEQSFDLEYKFPYVFNSNSSFSISPFGQRLDETNYLLLRGGITNSFIYQHTRDFTSTIAYEFTRNREDLIDYPDIVERPPNLYNISALQLSTYYGKTMPDWGEGWIVRPFAEFSGFLDTGALLYQRFLLDVRRYINLPTDSQFAFRVDGGMIFSDQATPMPEHIRLYAGGTNSVRGWQRRMLGPKRPFFDDGEFQGYLPAGGDAMATFNVEFRQQMDFLLNNLGMAVFLDGGQIWEQPSDARLDDLKFGVGGGIRYSSPVGPIRLDLGYKINPSDEDLNIYNGTDYGSPRNRWGIHFSIGQAF